MGLLLAGLAGTLIAIQAHLLGRFTTSTGPFTTALLVQGAGFVLAAAWATATGGWGPVTAVAARPGWPVAGLVGWLLLVLLGQAAADLGPGVALAVVVATQLVVAFAIDAATGQAMLDLRALVSLALLVAGVLGLVVRG